MRCQPRLKPFTIHLDHTRKHISSFRKEAVEELRFFVHCMDRPILLRVRALAHFPALEILVE